MKAIKPIAKNDQASSEVSGRVRDGIGSAGEPNVLGMAWVGSAGGTGEPNG